MTKRKKFLLGLFGLLAALWLWDTWLYYFHTPKWEPLFVSTSPDGRFSMSVYFNPGVPLPSWIHPRGRSGTVVLRESKTGKVLQRAASEYVHATGEPTVYWSPERNRVGVVSLGGWDLPPE